jgi:hypothetical protein
MKIANVDTGSAVLIVGTVALYSTGHWIGGTVLLLAWIVSTIQTNI